MTFKKYRCYEVWIEIWVAGVICVTIGVYKSVSTFGVDKETISEYLIFYHIV